MRKKFSVIIPTYNRSIYLRSCLEALFTEIDRQDVGVLVVDDGSCLEQQCRNREICLSFKAGYHFISNAGSAQSRNAGLQRCRSEWIVFIDDDVCVNSGWYAALRSTVNSAGSDILGIEGQVVSSGGGVWDREVSNSSGGLYLTCNMVYRRSILDKVGGFDQSGYFPPCEDHELAARILEHGKLLFNPQMCVTHMPRTVKLKSFIKKAPHRIRRLLYAEYHFYSIRPHAYKKFRHAANFWGTYRSILMKHVVISLRRRDIGRLLKHPLQTGVLVTGLLIEQLGAWALLPAFVRRQKSWKSESEGTTS